MKPRPARYCYLSYIYRPRPGKSHIRIAFYVSAMYADCHADPKVQCRLSRSVPFTHNQWHREIHHLMAYALGDGGI